MQRLFEIASIAPSAVPISTRASRTKKFSQAQGLARKTVAATWKQPCAGLSRQAAPQFFEQFWVQ
jgi:hypothetical protein